MKTSQLVLFILLLAVGWTSKGFAYPPAVGILGPSKNCLACHADNGPWTDEKKTVIDILDRETKRSLRQGDRFKVTEQMKTFVEVGGQILTCGTCLKIRGQEATELCPLSTMSDLYDLIAGCDRVVSF